MGLLNADIQKAIRIKNAVSEYLENSGQSKIMAKDLMPILVKKGIFPKDHKDGLPIRDFLRQLEEHNHLHLIPQAHYEQKDIKKNWYFIKTLK